jgi:hypothetical protein
VKNYSKGLRNAHISSGSGRLQGEGQLLQLLWLALADAKPRQQRGCGTTKKPHRDQNLKENPSGSYIWNTSIASFPNITQNYLTKLV